MAGFWKKWMDGRMQLLIAYVPIELKKEYVLPNPEKGFYYDFVSDERIVVDEQYSKGLYYFGGAMMGFALIVALLAWGGVGMTTGAWYVLYALIGLGLILWIIAYTVPRKEVVLDRKNGLFSFPDWFYRKPHTVPFQEAKVFWTSSGGHSGALGMNLTVAPPNSIRGIGIGMHAAGFDYSWSFMVWYMDKNRPLPPGDAFDAYRERDFQRRKAEGFPPPLYKSTFPTPEATPEQQAEREKYWRDEDYYGRSESAWY